MIGSGLGHVPVGPAIPGGTTGSILKLAVDLSATAPGADQNYGISTGLVELSIAAMKNTVVTLDNLRYISCDGAHIKNDGKQKTQQQRESQYPTPQNFTNCLKLERAANTGPLVPLNSKTFIIISRVPQYTVPELY